MKICPVCGAQMQDPDKFCDSCGARYETPGGAPQSAAQAVMQDEPPAAPGYTPPGRPQSAEEHSRQEFGEQGCAQTYAPPGFQSAQTQYAPRAAVPEADRNRPLSTWAYALALFLLRLPIVGLVLQIVWAVGGTNSLNRQNLARGYLFLRCCLAVLTLLILVVALAALAPLLRNLFNYGSDYFYYFFRNLY